MLAGLDELRELMHALLMANLPHTQHKLILNRCPPHIIKHLHSFPNRQLVRNEDGKKKIIIFIFRLMAVCKVFQTYSAHNTAIIKTIMN